jgi:hypothetical protein
VIAPSVQLRAVLPRVREAMLLCVVRGLTSFLAYASGFRALSDDDYARIVIAQRFAQAPSFDPSHSSWLPAPFWLYGAALRAIGTDLAVARGTAIALSITATLLVYIAARMLGACRPGALVGAALSSILPYSALLGIAAVPEVPCAALVLFGAATLARKDATLRALGGLALSAACLSRYEAWPVAAVFAGLCLCGAWRQRRLLVGAALALFGPALWLLVGHVEHGAALFFVTRVASYRKALGPAASGPLASRLLEYPRLLLCAEPELWALALVLAIAAWRSADRAKLTAYRRPSLALLALLAFMMVGSMRGEVPTHHAARVLLPIWFFACVLCGHGLAHLVSRASGQRRVALLSFAAVATLVGLFFKSTLLPIEGFAERSTELDAGSEAKRRHLERLAIDTPDYGYLAVQAAFGSPTRGSTLDDHDPRHPRPPDPFLNEVALASALGQQNARFLVTTLGHAALAKGSGCAELWRNTRFALLECAKNPPPARDAH